jgi:hypothetical protein
MQNWGGAAAGGATGALSGAMVGTMIAPGIGTAIGAFAGGLLGGLGGLFGGGGNDNKYYEWIQRANAVANETYDATKIEVDKLIGNLQGTNQIYRDNIAKYSSDFNKVIGDAIGAAPDFTTATTIAEQNKLAALGEYKRDAATLETDAAETALSWNEANLNRINAFASALEAEAQKSALEGAFLAQPGLKQTLRQFDLNMQADSRGILSADVAAQVARGAAQTGRNAGVQGEMLQNLTLRDLGLNSLARMDQAVKNQAMISSDIVNPLLQGTKVDRNRLVDTMGLSTELVLNANQKQLDLAFNTRLGIEDDRRNDAALVLGIRDNAAKYDYGVKAGMEGSIYSGTLNTQNNAADIMSNAAVVRGNQKLGITSQAMQLQNSQDVANTEFLTGMTTSLMDSTATLAGAYMASKNGGNLYTGKKT